MESVLTSETRRTVARPALESRVAKIGARMMGQLERLCDTLEVPGCREMAKGMSIGLIDPGREAEEPGTRTNAFARYDPGEGRHRITIGSDLAARHEDRALAAIIGHEMGELVVKQIVGQEGAAQILEASPTARALTAKPAIPLAEGPSWGRQWKEVVCDRIGQKLARGAGYAKGGMFEVFRQMAVDAIRRDGDVDAALGMERPDSTHPSALSRMVESLRTARVGQEQGWEGFAPAPEAAPATPGWKAELSAPKRRRPPERTAAPGPQAGTERKAGLGM